MEWRKLVINENYEINVQGEIRNIRNKNLKSITKNICILNRNNRSNPHNIIDLLELMFSPEELLSNTQYRKVRYFDIDNLDNEEWADIPGWEGYYKASSLGRIKGVYREIIYKTGKKYRYYPSLLSPKMDKDGYLDYCLSRDRGGVYRRGHRLVAQAFIPNPNNLPQVNHIDGNKQNNHVSNLEWCTNLSNIQHSWEMRLRGENIKRGEESNLSKLKERQVLEIRARYNKKTCNYKILSNEFGVSISQISNIIKRVTWKHI